MKRESKRAHSWLVNPTVKVALGYALRRRNAPFRNHRIDSLAEAAALLSLLVLRERGATPSEIARCLKSLPSALISDFVARGILVAPHDVPARVRFDATLVEGGLARVLPHASVRRDSESPVRLAKGVFFQGATRRPKALQKQLELDDFDMSPPLAWVRHPGTRMVLPYRCERVRGRLDETTAHALARAHVLVPPGWEAAEARRWRARTESTRTHVAEEGYAVLPGVLPAPFLASMRSYYRRLAGEGYLELDTEQVIEKRLTIHDERVLRHVHRQMAPLVRAVTGEALKPSYSLLARYLEGAVLEKHVDRPQCRWNVSLALDDETDRGAVEPWPIYLRARNRTVGVKLGPGDALLYRGTDVPHWRKALPRGRCVTMGLLHFVEKSFEGPLV